MYSMLQIDQIDFPFGPAEALDVLQGQECACFLDSALAGTMGQWSYVAVRPFANLAFENGQVRIDGRSSGGDPFGALHDLLEENRMPSCSQAPPLACGAIGYLSYDLGRYLEDIPSTALNDLPLPDLAFALYDCVLAFECASGRVCLCSLPSGRDTAEFVRERLRRAKASALPMEDARSIRPSPADWSAIDSTFSRSDYLRAVLQVKEYIAAGDVYQVNLSQRFSKRFAGSPWELYRALREVNPSPFGCYLDLPGLVLACASPERLIRLDAESRIVETRPIKGTRPRGMNDDDDRRLASELASSPKDRAENLMIVDMERNDLGKVCEYGSVHVPELWAIEEHPNVFQMVSTVRGVLARDKSPTDLLAACFPGGSITGAPKVRAMQIIEELEPTRRGIYTGSAGYIDFRGNMDFNIVIRSMVLRDGRAYFHGGGGVVTDSAPEAEYQETLDKVTGLVTALARVEESSDG